MKFAGVSVICYGQVIHWCSCSNVLAGFFYFLRLLCANSGRWSTKELLKVKGIDYAEY